MLIQTLDSTRIDEGLAKVQPDYLYNGEIPKDNDRLDFVEIKIQGVRVG